jgi:hypothetical protein
MSELSPYSTISGKHLYNRGWLGLIPLVGAFVGIGLVVLGLIKYRDRKLILIGCAAILFTIIIYGSLFYYAFYSKAGEEQFARSSQTFLNELVKDIEFYKIQNGDYPDSLQQLVKPNEIVWLDDPILARRPGTKNTKFNYQKIGNKYTLFSSGLDRIPNTTDDIYPTVALSDTSKFGLIIRK